MATEQSKLTSAAEIQAYINMGVFAQLRITKNVAVHAELLLSDTILHTLVEGSNGEVSIETSRVAPAGSYLIRQDMGTYQNEYAISAEKFKKLYTKIGENKYEPTRDENGNFPSKVAYKSTVDLTFEPPWGGTFTLFKGGCLIPEAGTFYGINPRELYATHSVVEFEDVCWWCI